MNTDASIGFARTGPQSAEAAFNLCEADNLAHVCLAGTTFPADPADKQNLARGGKLVTALSARARRVWPSGPRPLEGSRTSTFDAFWPLAPRRLAAPHYARSSGARSTTWYWAAASRLSSPPEPLLRPSRTDVESHVHVPAVKPAPRLPAGIERLEWRVYVAMERPPLVPCRYRPLPPL